MGGHERRGWSRERKTRFFAGDYARRRFDYDRRIAIPNQGVHSFLFFNYPESWGVVELWRVFKWHGRVVDIYLAKKRLRNGAKFGFVRFVNVVDAQCLERRLNFIMFGVGKLKAFIAHDDRRPKAAEKEKFCSQPTCISKQPSGRKRVGISRSKYGRVAETNLSLGQSPRKRSFADVVREGRGEENHPREGRSEENHVMKEVRRSGSCWNSDNLCFKNGIANIEACNQEWLHNCIIGSVKEVDHLEDLNSICYAEGIEPLDIKILGGLDVLINLGNPESVMNVIRNPIHGLKQWFNEVFSNIRAGIEDVVNEVQEVSFFWLKNREKHCNMPWHCWISTPGDTLLV